FIPKSNRIAQRRTVQQRGTGLCHQRYSLRLAAGEGSEADGVRVGQCLRANARSSGGTRNKRSARGQVVNDARRCRVRSVVRDGEVKVTFEPASTVAGAAEIVSARSALAQLFGG